MNLGACRVDLGDVRVVLEEEADVAVANDPYFDPEVRATLNLRVRRRISIEHACSQ